MLGQPISMLIPEVIGFRFTGALREGVTATDLVLTVTQMLRKKGVVGKFVEYAGHGLDNRCRSKTGRRWRTWRRNMARPAASSRPTRTRSDYLGLAAAIRIALRSWKHTPKRKELWRGAGSRTPSSHPHARTRSLDRRAEPRRSAPPAGSRAACPRGGWFRRCVGGHAEHDARRPGGEYGQRGRRSCRAPRKIRRGGRRELQDRGRSCCHRGDHLVHQHLEPERSHGGGPACPQSRRKGPQAEAVGEDVAGARQPGRHRLPDQIRACRAISTRLASTSSAMAARPASAIPGRLPNAITKAIQRERSHRGGRSLRQPQFRGPHQSGRARELSRLAAAGASPTRWRAR